MNKCRKIINYVFCYNRIKKRKGVYILQLKDNKYYIGQSDNIDRRIWYHNNYKGSKWTTKYEVIKELKSEFDSQKYFWELIETLNYMKIYGIDNVRGSMFTNMILSEIDKIMATQLYCELNNLCRKCGKEGHYINQCKETELAEWIDKFGGKLEYSRSCIICNIDINNLPSYFKYCRACYSKSIKN